MTSLQAVFIREPPDFCGVRDCSTCAEFSW
jgi:hypothetical protein